jgi:hypothetical protein
MKIHNLPKLVKDWGDLEAAGIPLEPLGNRIGIDPRNPGTGLTIRVGRDRWRNQICELKNGRFAYVLSIFVRRNDPGKTIIRECWISPPWVDTNIEWLEDPREEGQHPWWYKIPSDTEHFAREKVLNHRMHGGLSKGDIREGLLLAVGGCPPETYKDHDEVTVTFTIMDQWDCEHSATLQMRINRRPPRAKAITKRTRGPLLSRRDVIAPARSSIAPPVPTAESNKKNAEAIRSSLDKVNRFNSERKHAELPIGPKTGSTRAQNWGSGSPQVDFGTNKICVDPHMAKKP